MTTAHGQAVGSAWPATGCGSRRAMQRRTTASGPQRRLVRRTRMEEPRVDWGGMPGIVARVRLAAATVTAPREKVYGTVYSMMRPGRLQGKPIATTPFGAGVTKVLRFAPSRGYHDVYKFSGSIVCDVRSLGAGPLARRPSLPFQVRHQEAVMRQKCQPPARGWTRVRRSLSRGLCWTVPALLALVVSVEAQQSSSVLGTVVSSGSLRPLAGAQVYVEGTDRGTLTDANGRFALTGLSGSQVTINVVMIGYREVSTTVPVGATDVRIELSESALALDQIVVTGQVGGTQRRAIGNSIASVNAAEAVEIAPISSVQELINGRAAGVVIMPGTGMVGSGSVVRIRGNSTFSLSGDPLIYVDGVRVLNETGSGISVQAFSSGVVSRLNDFNVNDIESIEILKGPAAATLYGTEASRGVINIITKKGSPGGTSYTAHVKQGANWFSDPEGRMPVNYWRNPANGEVQSLNITEREGSLGRPLFRTGRQQGYGVSVSGGAENLRYYIGVDTEENEGAERNNWKDQMSTRVNLQVLPHENVDIAVSAGYVKNQAQFSCEAGCGGLMWGAVFANPALLGENCAVGAAYGCGFSRGFQTAPPERYYVFDVTQDIDRMTASVTGNWKPLSWMSHRLTVGTDFTAEQNEEYQP